MKNKEKSLAEILSIIPQTSDIIVPLGNGEPVSILNGIDENPDYFKSLRIHQMLEMSNKRYMHGNSRNIQYYSYFMSTFARNAFLNNTIELIPNHFHQMPTLLELTTDKPVIIAQSSNMNEEGYFSLGTSADYVSYFIGKVPIILEVNKNMPHTYGENNIHVSDILGYVRSDKPLHELKSAPIGDSDIKIAEFVAERINSGSTLQVGIGSIPNAILSLLKNHKDLGIHTEMLTDGVMDLEKSGVVTGSEKKTHVGKIVATFALGSKELYDYMNENKKIEMLPVHYTNDPRIIAREDNMVAINATSEVDFYGQCASETIAGKYYSSTGGQVDFGVGARFSKNGKSFICLYSTAKNEGLSKIKPVLTQGSVVTTSKNDVDMIVTEYGVAELKGVSLQERTKRLIAIAHPKFRDELKFHAKKMGLI